MAVIGIERLKTKAFQFDVYALPGSPKKLMLLKKAANSENPTIQPGILPPPEVNCEEVLFLKKKLAPNITLPRVSTRKTIRSRTDNFI